MASREDSGISQSALDEHFIECDEILERVSKQIREGIHRPSSQLINELFKAVYLQTIQKDFFGIKVLFDNMATGDLEKVRRWIQLKSPAKAS